MENKQTAKQTAVEWLAIQVNSDCLNSTFIRKELIDEALAMEKEQVIHAYQFGIGDAYNYTPNEGEVFYNETYGKPKR